MALLPSHECVCALHALTNGGACRFDVGFSEDENLKWRKSMEDTHVIQVPFMESATSGFFAVYDGHGGKEAADIVSSELHHFLKDELQSGVNGSVQESFVKVLLRSCLSVSPPPLLLHPSFLILRLARAPISCDSVHSSAFPNARPSSAGL